MDVYLERAVWLLTIKNNEYYRRKIMYYAASKPKSFLGVVEDDVMLLLQKGSGIREEPADYMSKEWDVWYDECTALIENKLCQQPEFLAIVGDLPIQDIKNILDALEQRHDVCDGIENLTIIQT